MDSPNTIASSRIGIVGSIEPVAVNPSGPDRCPHWNTHTITPNVADSDRTFITMALTGRTTEPKARKSSRNVATAVTSAIHGRVPPRLDSSSTSCAVVPPTGPLARGGPAAGAAGARRGGERRDAGDDLPGRR